MTGRRVYLPGRASHSILSVASVAIRAFGDEADAGARFGDEMTTTLSDSAVSSSAPAASASSSEPMILSHAMTNRAANTKKATMITTKVRSFLTGSSSTVWNERSKNGCTATHPCWERL